MVDRVEIDQGGGPTGLESTFGATDVPVLARAVAVGEHSDKAFDSRPRATQVFFGVGILQSSASGLEQILATGDRQLAAAGVGRTTRLQRAVVAAPDAEVDHALTVTTRLLWDRDHVTLRAGDGASLQVDLELALADPLLANLALWHAGQYLDAALLHVLTGLLIAIRRVTENPIRLQLLRLLVDQLLGLRAVVSARVADLDRGNQRLLAVGDRNVQLEAIKALGLRLAAVADLRIDRRDDPPLPGTAMQPRDAVIVDIEVLTQQLTQEPVSLGDCLIIDQPLGLLDRAQRPLGVLRDPGQHPLPLGLDPPATIRLLRRSRYSNSSPSASVRAACSSTVATASISLLTPWRTSLTVSGVAAAPSIGVESTICSAGASSIPSPSASRKLLSSASRSLPCNSRSSTVARCAKP